MIEELGAGFRGCAERVELINCAELKLPAIRAWARAELSAFSDGEIETVLREWCRTPRTRGELVWLERTLARSLGPGWS
jgi:hypothetical protein